MYNKAHNDALLALETMIKETIQHWTKARDGVQSSLVGILSHTHLTDSQDHVARLVNMLIDGIGDGINGNALREWCSKHLNMILNKENKMSCKKYDREALSTTAVGAACLWYKLAPQRPVLFDLDAQIVALLKKAETNKLKTPESLPEGSKINVGDDAMTALKAIAEAAATRVEMRKAEQAVSA